MMIELEDRMPAPGMTTAQSVGVGVLFALQLYGFVACLWPLVG